MSIAMPGSRLPKSFLTLLCAGLAGAAGLGLSADSARAQARLVPAPAPEIRGDAGETRGEAVQVVVDHAKVLRLPDKAQTVIVGNPAIADVTVQRNGVMVITGKSYGVTNLIALDATGALLAEFLRARRRCHRVDPDRAARARARELFLHAGLPAECATRRRQDLLREHQRPKRRA